MLTLTVLWLQIGWVAVDNENAGDENEPNQWWYYFGANGKAYKRNDSATGDVL